MISAIVTAVAFIAAMLILPRYVFGGRGLRRGRIRVRYGPSRSGQALSALGRLFVRYWMFTFPVAFAVIVTMIGFALIS